MKIDDESIADKLRELGKQLCMSEGFPPDLYNEAADRIEALEKALQRIVALYPGDKVCSNIARAALGE